MDLESVRDLSNVVLNIAGWDNHRQTFSLVTSIDENNWDEIGSGTEETGVFVYPLAHKLVRYIKFESYYSSDFGQVNVYEIEAYAGEVPETTHANAGWNDLWNDPFAGTGWIDPSTPQGSDSGQGINCEWVPSGFATSVSI